MTEAYAAYIRAGGILDWSPDGKFIAVADRSAPQEHVSILLLSVETGQKKIVTSPPDPYLASPTFSPDGKTLAFVQGPGFVAHDIYLVPVAGGEPRRLSFDKRTLRGLTWTSDGKEIAFSSNRGGLFSLWRVSASGGAPGPLNGVGRRRFRPIYFPPGEPPDLCSIQRELKYLADRGPKLDGPGRFADQVNFLDARKRISRPLSRRQKNCLRIRSLRQFGDLDVRQRRIEPRPLTSLDSPDTVTPRWSPGGQQIAFDSRLEGHADIFVISAEGGSPRRLTTEPFENNVPSWSRDRQWVYFSSNRTGTWQIWKVSAGGGSAVQVTRHGGFGAFESLDGKFVFYYYGGSMWRMPVEGDEEVRILDNVTDGYWTVLDKGICFLNSMATPPEIEFFDFATHRLKRVTTIDTGPKVSGPAGCAVSPDGKWILYKRVDQIDSEIMLVENFR